MLVGFDTSVLAYLAGVTHGGADEAKAGTALALLARFPEATKLIVPVQALGELCNVLRRAGVQETEVSARIDTLLRRFEPVSTSLDILRQGIAISARHDLQTWDSIILAACVDSGCTLFLCEDMQHGFQIRGLTIVDPFKEPPHPALAALID